MYGRMTFAAWLLCLFALCGCGGSGKGISKTTPVKLSIAWGERGRALNAPSSALSAVITLANANPTGGDFIYSVNRDPAPQAFTGNYTSANSAKTGAVNLTIRFYAQTEGIGTVVGVAQAKIILQPDGTGIGNVVTANSISSISIPAGLTVPVGQTTDLTFTARDAKANLVAVTPGSAVFTVVSGGDKLQIVNGQAKGLAAGAATIRATLDGNNSADTPVTVNRLTPLAYAITELPPLSGEAESMATSLNTQGMVVGVSTSKSGTQSAVMWRNGNVSLLGVSLTSEDSSPVQINEAGQVIGMVGNRAFFWQNGATTDMGTLNGVQIYPKSINNNGVVAGYSSAYGSIAGDHGFLWQKGRLTDLGKDFRPRAINDAGVLAGSSDFATYSPDTAAQSQNGTIANLPGEPSGVFSWATTINNAGHIAGISFGYYGNGLFWKDGEVTQLPLNMSVTSNYYYTQPNSLNDLDQIVGEQGRSTSNVVTNAFLYSEGNLIDLQTLLPADSGWHLESAAAINNNGLIVGVGQHNGKRRAFLLTPQ